MAVNRLKPPRNLRIEFKPSPRQYELWKLLQPNYCPHCGGEIEQILIGYDQQGNPQYRPQCRHCKSQNLPQLILGGGAAGGGKSYIGSVWLVSSCIRFENIRAVVARKTLKSLKESTWNTIKSILKDWGLKEDTNYKINNLEGTLTFWNDSVIIMKEMADIPSDPNFERFGSSEYTIAMVDEVSEISERAVAVFRARKEFGGDDRVAVDERLTRIPLLDPVEHVGIDPVLARDTRLGFRPDERQMIDNTGNCHGNIYCSVVGEGRRTGGDNVG